LKYRKWAGCIIAMSEELPEVTSSFQDHYPVQLKAWSIVAEINAIVLRCLNH
jgi:hypothetical protein